MIPNPFSRKKKKKWPRYTPKYIHAIIRSAKGRTMTWESINWNYRTEEAPKELTDLGFQFDIKYLLKLKGWVPYTKYDPLLKKLRAVYKHLFSPEQHHIILYNIGTPAPLTLQFLLNKYEGTDEDYNGYTPEMLQYVAQSNLTEEMFKSLPKKGKGKMASMKWLIIAFIAIGIAVGAKMMGVI